MSALVPAPSEQVETSPSKSLHVIKTPKNLKYMAFPRTVNVNDAKELRIAARECEDILGVLNGQIKALESVAKTRWG
jgi:hypothetical protein